MPTFRVEPARGTLHLDTPVQYIKGIGPRRAEQLSAHQILTVADLLNYSPFRYEDRSQFRPLSMLREGEWILARARILSVGEYRPRRGGVSVFEMLVGDGKGRIRLKFFNQPYLRQVFHEKIDLIIYGQVKRDGYSGGGLCLINPECEILEPDGGESVHTGRIVPIYRRLGDTRGRTLRVILHTIVTRLPSDLNDPLPAHVRRKYGFLPRNEALARVHFPEVNTQSTVERARDLEALNRGLSPAHKRLIFEELFQLQVGIRMVRAGRMRISKERRIQLSESVRQAIKRILPFHPTGAQKRVLKEVADDMRSARPMSRLLQGDVGSGKTIVAAQAAIIAVENGFQAAIMAPTEILAEQHYFNFRRLLTPIDYRVELLKGKMRAKEKREILARIQDGKTQITIGTHALIQQGVQFSNLALVIIDEQHRFGVMQRNVLKEKGRQTDVLVMTATPIPRSLALTLYGDLDVSVIDELPPGRKPIETWWLDQAKRRRAYEQMQRTISEGHQVYVVYPLVEESEKSDLRAATEMAEHLSRKVFPNFRIGLLHGRMKSAEKEQIMAAFSGGELQILVSTTVIEVGVDVPNATLMVIEHAERFGLAQLHQLRGRVGRGAAQSLCILVADVRNNTEVQRRLEVMCETNDGFRIAEVDLELRGPGEVMGTRQSGVPVFNYANLVRDRKELELARLEADRFIDLLKSGPDEESRRIVALVRRRWRDRYGLALVG